MSTTTSGLTFDVGTILGIGTPCADPIEGREGYITLRVPEGISLISLRAAAIGKELIWQEVAWYDVYDWAKTPIAPGIYHLRLPIPGSNRKTFAEQQQLLLPGEEPIPVTLAALALLCFKKAGRPDPLLDGWVRTARGSRVGLGWYGGRLFVNDFWGDGRSDCVWVGGVGTSK